MQDFLLSVIRNERNGITADLLRGGFCFLSWVYNVGLKTYLNVYKFGIRKQTTLSVPVISIGNLTVGGTGKTPFTIWMCERLLQAGINVGVLSRGYRSKHEFGVKVVSDGKSVILPQDEAGDESFMLARVLRKAPVLIGKDRRVTGQLAIDKFHPDALILDDGMQFYQLKRDVEIVLVDATHPFDNGWTFPRGLLREPVTHIRRAHVIVITRCEQVDLDTVDLLEARCRSLAPKALITRGKMEATDLLGLDSHKRGIGELNGMPVAAVCALGNPDSFRRTLDQCGANVVLFEALTDHAKLDAGTLETFLSDAQRLGARAVVVTEKDAVKLPPIMRPLPWYAVRVRMSVMKEDAILNVIIPIISANRKQKPA